MNVKRARKVVLVPKPEHMNASAEIMSHVYMYVNAIK